MRIYSFIVFSALVACSNTTVGTAVDDGFDVADGAAYVASGGASGAVDAPSEPDAASFAAGGTSGASGAGGALTTGGSPSVDGATFDVDVDAGDAGDDGAVNEGDGATPTTCNPNQCPACGTTTACCTLTNYCGCMFVWCTP